MFSEGHTLKDHLFDERALQEYILICCQNSQGGLIDKPGKSRDAYHTCYSLSGLSLAQHFSNEKRILGNYKNELVNKILSKTYLVVILSYFRLVLIRCTIFVQI